MLLKAIFVLSPISACNYRNNSDEIMTKFDSVSKSLEKTNDRFSQSSAALYDSIVKKYGEAKLQQFSYHVNDCKEYLKDLKYRFTIFCGDSSGQTLPEESLDNFNLSNSFFIEAENGKKLQAQLENIRQFFLLYTQKPDLKQKIEQLGAVPLHKEKDGFVKTYFSMVPPVAAMTIISKFENDIKTIESAILKEYLSK